MRSGGKRGRGAAGKTPFVAAVSTSPEGRPRKLKLAPVKGFPQARDRARRQTLAGPRSGGCDGRPGLLERTRRSRLQPPGDPHRVGPTGGPQGIVQMVNTTLGNIKSAITGIYRQLGPDSRRALPRQFRLALQPALSTRNHDPAFRP